MLMAHPLRALLMHRVIRRGRRGVALPIVLVVVAVMTTVVVQFVHDTRTNLHMAANVRDEVRAFYNAKAGMDLARLALGAQAMIDTLTGSRMNVQVWQYLQTFMGAFNAARVDTPFAAVDLSEVKGLGGMKGAFDVDIEPEDGKINLNALSGAATPRITTIAQLSMLMAPAENRDLFEKKDDKGSYNDIPELIASLIDWIDPDDMLTSMNADGHYNQAGGAGESSRFGGFGETVDPRNHRMDTVAEIHMIKGFNDDWWEAFGEALTVYPSPKINVNTAPPILIAVLMCSYLADPQDPICDPFAPQRLFIAVNAVMSYRTLKQALFMTPFASKRSFVSFLTSGGQTPIDVGGMFAFEPIRVNSARLRKDIAVRSPKVYKITAKGRVGNTLKTLTAVIDIGKKGRLYYWREL